MNPIEHEIEKISDAVIEMMELVRTQLERCKESFMNNDKDLADQIIYSEGRVNSLELIIDKYCENAIVRFGPVATDLRFLVSMLKINADLERIGDYASGIADYINDVDEKWDPVLLNNIKAAEMFDLAIDMVDSIEQAYIDEDTKRMKKLFKKDKSLNKINREKSEIIADYIRQNPDKINMALYLHSTIKKLERVGDHTKNIAEDYIFYTEAKVFKHKKSTK